MEVPGDVPSAKVVELRVHGVSGTPPEEMLETHHARQEAGDEYSRFFVAVDCFGDKPPDPVEDGTGPHVRPTRLEGFHWGRYTSGNWRQALWLALIPFGMVNAAQFMLSPPSTWWERFFHTVVGGALRLLAFGLTATFALAGASISIDLVARQRLADTGLGQALGHGTLLAGGAVAAALAVYVLYRLGRRNTTVREPPEAADTLGASLGDASGLTRKRFYAGDPDATSLGRLHLAGGWATVALVGSLTDGDAQLDPTSLGYFVYAASAGLLTALAVLVAVVGDPEHSAPRSWERGSALSRWNRVFQHPRVGLAAALIALGVLLSSVVMLVLRGVNPDNPLAAVDVVSNTLVVVLTGTLLVLFAAAAGLARATRHLDEDVPRPFRRYAAGMAAPVVAALGGFLAVGYTAALLLASAELLVDDAALPALVEGVTFTWGLSVLLLVLVGSVVGVRTWSDRDWRTQRVRRSYARVHDPASGDHAEPPPWLTDERVRRIATASAVARVKLGLPTVLICFSAIGMALAVFIAIDLMTGTGAPADVLPDDWVQVISRLGALTLIALAGVLMTTARQSLRARDRQRVVNVVWDVVSFWPRSVHPFVPPPYSQFAVQSLRDRIRHHLGTCLEEESPTTEVVADAVVVEAHSQGSFISVAALLWLNPRELSRVGFLTFGSQLQVIFPRAFPAYTSYRVLTELDRALGGRWINLFRETDPIAGPVLSWGHTGEEDRGALLSRRLGPPATTGEPWPLEPDHVPPTGTGRRECGRDWRLLDPSPPDALLQAEPLSSMMQHSHFALSPDWADAVAWLEARVLGRAPDVPAPREDVRVESGADEVDEVGEMMGPVDYQAHD